MAYVAINSEEVTRFAGSATIITHQLSVNDRWVAGIHKANSTDDVARVLLVVTASTGTSPTYRIGVESVDSSGDPTGTYLGATASAYADVTTLAVGSNSITLGEVFTPTLGQAYATTIRYQTGTIGGSNFRTVVAGYTPFAPSGSPFAQYGDASATRLACLPAVIAGRTDASAVGPSAAISSITANSWSSINSPLYRGASSTTTAATEVQGITFLIHPGSAPFDTHFLINTDSTPLVSQSWVPGANIEDTGAVQCVTWRFASPIECPARATMRFMLNPTSTTAIQAFPALVFPTITARAAFIGRFASSGATATTLGSYSLQVFNINPVRFDISGVELPGYWFSG